MKYVDEYREARAVQGLAEEIRGTVTRPWNLMEVCGGQTHAIVRFGLDRLLPEGLNLLHGPGCPVCVTPMEAIDLAQEVAALPGVALCTFGDMLRVPGSHGDLLSVKAAGGDVRMIYSPLDALALAEADPSREFVFFSVGFETTAPASAMAVYQARRRGIANFSLLLSHVLVPPAMEAILASPRNRVQGFLAAGHVCTIMGWEEYRPIAERFRVPIVVTGFEPLDILEGVLLCVKQLEAGRHEVDNQYRRSVRQQGNPRARAMLEEIYRIVPQLWRGIGEIAASGLALREEYAAFDAEQRFRLQRPSAAGPGECQSGSVLRGEIKPNQCPAFGTRCHPERPLGAPMVSSEGACAAYYRYRGAASPSEATPSEAGTRA